MKHNTWKCFIIIFVLICLIGNIILFSVDLKDMGLLQKILIRIAVLGDILFVIKLFRGFSIAQATGTPCNDRKEEVIDEIKNKISHKKPTKKSY